MTFVTDRVPLDVIDIAEAEIVLVPQGNRLVGKEVVHLVYQRLQYVPQIDSVYLEVR